MTLQKKLVPRSFCWVSCLNPTYGIAPSIKICTRLRPSAAKTLAPYSLHFAAFDKAKKDLGNSTQTANTIDNDGSHWY